jgi:hypothetical protein
MPKCDACITAEARHQRTFNVLVSDGRMVATLEVCDICEAVSTNLANAILRTGKLWKRPGVTPPKAKPAMTQAEMSRARGYSGDACSTCNMFSLRQSGHCQVCDNCGSTTGCS